MTYDFEVSDIIPATPQRIYEAWMSSDGHAEMTGSDAEIDPVVGGEYQVWDGYITGRTLELEPYHRILQSWRTTEFSVDDTDSTIEVLLDPVAGGTKLTVRHAGVPSDQTSYELGGWQDSYFEPMKAYFA